jgi:hypothetical protein
MRVPPGRGRGPGPLSRPGSAASEAALRSGFDGALEPLRAGRVPCCRRTRQQEPAAVPAGEKTTLPARAGQLQRGSASRSRPAETLRAFSGRAPGCRKARGFDRASVRFQRSLLSAPVIGRHVRAGTPPAPCDRDDVESGWSPESGAGCRRSRNGWQCSKGGWTAWGTCER